MSDHTRENEAAWDRTAAWKYEADVEGDVALLRGGGTGLLEPEIRLLGDLSGCARAIHPQCSHGLPALSLWKLGARGGEGGPERGDAGPGAAEVRGAGRAGRLDPERLEIGTAVFFIRALRDPAWYRPALFVQAASLGGVVLARLAGIVIDGSGEPLLFLLGSSEAAVALLGFIALRRLDAETPR